MGFTKKSQIDMLKSEYFNNQKSLYMSDFEFTDPKKAGDYLNFCLSKEGKAQQNLILNSLEGLLPKNSDLRVLDAGCGMGWLSGELVKRFKKIHACDSSTVLLNYAKEHFPGVEYVSAHLQNRLPYADAGFDLIIASLTLHDLPNLESIYKEFQRILKPNGELIVVELNAYYAHPVGKWIRSLSQKMFGGTPKFYLNDYGQMTRSNKKFNWGNNFSSLFYTMPEIINAAIAAGFTLEQISDVIPKNDSSPADIIYRSYRFPTFIILKFKRA